MSQRLKSGSCALARNEIANRESQFVIQAIRTQINSQNECDRMRTTHKHQHMHIYAGMQKLFAKQFQ